MLHMPVTTLPRRPEAWLRIGGIAVGLALVVVSTVLGATIYRGDVIVVFLAALVHAASLPLALVRPGLAAATSSLAAPVIMVAARGGDNPWPWAVTTMITQALVLAVIGYRSTWVLGAGTLVLNIGTSGILTMLVQPYHDQQSVAINLVVATFVFGATLAGGMVTRGWGVIRSQLERERRLSDAERARRQLAEEKTRIARELHDVIAHSMSIITVQATSAPFRHPHTDEALRAEFDGIAASSRQALAEMRSLLGLLREQDAPVARTPQPRLSGIPELIAQAERSGVAVDLVGREALVDDGVSDVVGLTGYRIVQEALSNVLRHAPGAQVEVRAARDRALDLTVLNRGGGAGGAAASDAGSGLLGMRERAASVDGTISVGPLAGGGYEVHATLPLEHTT